LWPVLSHHGKDWCLCRGDFIPLLDFLNLIGRLDGWDHLWKVCLLFLNTGKGQFILALNWDLENKIQFLQLVTLVDITVLFHKRYVLTS